MKAQILLFKFVAKYKASQKQICQLENGIMDNVKKEKKSI